MGRLLLGQCPGSTKIICKPLGHLPWSPGEKMITCRQKFLTQRITKTIISLLSNSIGQFQKHMQRRRFNSIGFQINSCRNLSILRLFISILFCIRGGVMLTDKRLIVALGVRHAGFKSWRSFHKAAMELSFFLCGSNRISSLDAEIPGEVLWLGL